MEYIVGGSLIFMVKRGFEFGELEEYLNKTLIILIPKVPGLEVISQFRLISLCTVPCKLLTKVFVNRLKPLLPLLIDENQASFVGGRHIMDNVVIAQEVVLSLKLKRGKTGWMVIKIDMEKAYDQLWWSFKKDTLEEARIPNTIVSLIMRCVSSSTLQVLWNGGFTEEFRPSRGVRQGDPISPYLFVLTMKRLGHAIKRAVSCGSWTPMYLSRGGPPLFHLLFFDDLVLFREASLDTARAM